MIHIVRDETRESVEKKLRNVMKEGAEVSLTPNHSVPKLPYGIGVEASILQLLATWSQFQKDPTYRLNGCFDANDPIYMSTLLLGRSRSKLDGVKPDTPVNHERLEGTHLIFDGTSRFRNVDIQYASEDKDAPFLYPRDFDALISKYASKEVPLGSVLSELLNNTSDWARTSVNGVPIRKSVRGVLFRNHSGGVFEMSVIDSGPGFTRPLKRSLGSGIDAKVFQPIEPYFQEGSSSSSVPHRGYGLSSVINKLSHLQGYLLLRTGTSLFQKNFPSSHDPKDFVFDAKRSGLARVVGSVFTIVLQIPES